jgi:hypothetical protein
VGYSRERSVAILRLWVERELEKRECQVVPQAGALRDVWDDSQCSTYPLRNGSPLTKGWQLGGCYRSRYEMGFRFFHSSTASGVCTCRHVVPAQLSSTSRVGLRRPVLFMAARHHMSRLHVPFRYTAHVYAHGL